MPVGMLRRVYVHCDHADLAAHFITPASVLDGFIIDGAAGFGHPLEARRVRGLTQRRTRMDELSAHVEALAAFKDAFQAKGMALPILDSP